MAGIARDTDLLLVNRNGVDYQAPASELRRPPVCELEELEEEKMPWEGHNGGIFHVIVDDHTAISANIGMIVKIYNLATLAEVSSIDDPGEYIITTRKDCDELFAGSPGNWDFGEFTDTSRVEVMAWMFWNCEKFNSDIGDWDVSNVSFFSEMFGDAAEFNQDLSQWCVSAVEMYNNFDRGAHAWEDKNKPVWGNCPRGEDGKREGLRIKRKRTK